MGHIVNPNKDYNRLQKRLDSMVTGAPNSPTLMKILKLLFSAEEANLAWRLPASPRTVSSLARKMKMDEGELGDRITIMAAKGLVVDLDIKGRRFVMLAPVVIGFFEYTFMRTRDDVPMKELAQLFDDYMFQEGELGHAIFQKQTQIGRSLVREEALPENYSEILDWERATKVVETASEVAVSMCACRHHHTHLGTACDRPLRTCLTLNMGVGPMVKAGIAEKITNKEAMKILEECKANGLAQTGDNVKHNLTYMCNCCPCCCGMMSAIKTFNIENAIVSSNFIMEVDTDTCKGCGKCVKACPANAIEIKKETGSDGKVKKWAVRNEDVCLGCGVCYGACKFGSISMEPREQRVYTPESVFEKTVAMAIERGKLSSLIFDDPEKLSHRALGKVVTLLEKSPPYKAAMAIEPLRSTFFDTIVKGAKKAAGL